MVPWRRHRKKNFVRTDPEFELAGWVAYFFGGLRPIDLVDPYGDSWQEPANRLAVDAYVMKIISDGMLESAGTKKEGPGMEGEYSTSTTERTSAAIAKCDTADYRELEEARNSMEEDPLIKRE